MAACKYKNAKNCEKPTSVKVSPLESLSINMQYFCSAITEYTV